MPPRKAIKTTASRQPLGEVSTNSIAPSAASTKDKAAPPSKKRKATTEKPQYHIDDDICQIATISCEAVRQKTRQFLKSGEMKVGEFQHAIGASGSTFGVFMRKKDEMGGSDSSVYTDAFAFFKLRELNGVKIKKKKIEKAPPAPRPKVVIEDFEGIILEGEEENEVPVYDSCDEIRMKIYYYLKETGMSQAAFSRQIGKMFTPEKKTVTGLAAFLAKSGPAAGNTCGAFYGSYVFFEKMRIRDGEPKTEHRWGMEDAWDGCSYGDFLLGAKPGMNVKKIIDKQAYIVPMDMDMSMYQDEFGRPIMG